MKNKPKLPQLKLENGSLLMLDDSNPKEYLKSIIPDQKVVVLPYEEYRNLKSLAAMAGIG